MLKANYLAFETYLLARGKHKNTVAKHLKNLRVLQGKLSDWLEVDCFLAELKQKNRSHACINAYIDTIRLYFDFAGITQEKPRHVRQLTNSVKQTLTPEQIEQIINLPCPPRCEKYAWIKFSCFLRLLAETGCRPGELAKTMQSSFGYDKMILEKTKTGKPRVVPISTDLAKLARTMPVEKFLVQDDIQHSSEGKTVCTVTTAPNLGYIFTTSTKRIYSDHSWDHAFKKRLRILGLKPMSIYVLRHSMATELLRLKNDSLVVARILGTSVEMISKTYEHLVIDDLRMALNRHPLMQKNADPKDTLKAISETLRAFGILDDSRFLSTLTDSGNSFSASVEIV